MLDTPTSIYCLAVASGNGEPEPILDVVVEVKINLGLGFAVQSFVVPFGSFYVIGANEAREWVPNGLVTRSLSVIMVGLRREVIADSGLENVRTQRVGDFIAVKSEFLWRKVYSKPVFLVALFVSFQ
jgi:hypothetical protein